MANKYLLTIGFALSSLLFGWVGFTSPSYQTCEAAHKNDQSDNKNTDAQNMSVRSVIVDLSVVITCEGIFADQNNGLITAVATVFLTIITGGLVVVGNRQINTAREQARAFIVPLGLHGYYTIDAAGEYRWQLRPVLKNTGSTPTKNMTMHSNCIVRDTNDPLPVDFNFDYVTQKIGSAFIGPGFETQGGLAPDTPVTALRATDILDAQQGRRLIYYMGWLKYNDIFPGTPAHITRFCWIIDPAGDPINEPINLAWNTILHTRGNCADEGCEC